MKSPGHFPSTVLALAVLICGAYAAGAPPMPDLVITDMWTEGGTVYYQIHNDSETSCPGGHATGLVVDSQPVAVDSVQVAMAPGQKLVRSFASYSWSCTPIDDDVMVMADATGSISEKDESNNTRTETWKCDETPPEILAGPAVSMITANSARISWVTDELASATVEFDDSVDTFAQSKSSLKMDTNHSVDLTLLSACGSTSPCSQPHCRWRPPTAP